MLRRLQKDDRPGTLPSGCGSRAPRFQPPWVKRHIEISLARQSRILANT
jgi:hypothetical protein